MLPRLEYFYTPEQVRQFKKDDSGLTPLERTLLDHLDDALLLIEVQ